MTNIIESKLEILGGKSDIKGTRIPIALNYELIGLNYSVIEILKIAKFTKNLYNKKI